MECDISFYLIKKLSPKFYITVQRLQNAIGGPGDNVEFKLGNVFLRDFYKIINLLLISFRN